MSDLISRADAISVLEIFTQTDTLGHTPKQIVEALPSAQPKHDISKANFLCPICGAEMEVEVSEWEGE